MKHESSRQSYEKSSTTNFMKIRPGGDEVFHAVSRTDIQIQTLFAISQTPLKTRGLYRHTHVQLQQIHVVSFSLSPSKYLLAMG